MVFEPEAQPRTIIVPGAGTQTLSFTLPEGVALKLESVLATINGGAGTPTPELIVTAPGGAVIAAKRQGSAVEAGAGNRATWALRLADDGGGAAGAGPWPTFGAEVARASTSQSIANNTVTTITFDTITYDAAGMTPGVGTFSELTVPVAALYLVEAKVTVFSNAGDNFAVQTLIGPALSPPATIEANLQAVEPAGAWNPVIPLAGLRMFSAGQVIRLRVRHEAGGNRNVQARMSALRVGTFV